MGSTLLPKLLKAGFISGCKNTNPLYSVLAQRAAAYDIKNMTTGWFTASTINTRIFIHLKKTMNWIKTKLEEKAELILVRIQTHPRWKI